VVVFHQRFSTQHHAAAGGLPIPIGTSPQRRDHHAVPRKQQLGCGAGGPVFRLTGAEPGYVRIARSVVDRSVRSRSNNLLELLLWAGLDPCTRCACWCRRPGSRCDMIDRTSRAFHEYYANAHGTLGRAGRNRSHRNGATPACTHWTARAAQLPAGASPRIGTSPSPLEAASGITVPRIVVHGRASSDPRDAGARLQTAELMDTQAMSDELLKKPPSLQGCWRGRAVSANEFIDPPAGGRAFRSRYPARVPEDVYNVSADERDEIIRGLAGDDE